VEHHKIRLYGFVIMPNHVHIIWRILAGYIYMDIQRDFLKFTAQQIKFHLINYHPKELGAHYVNKKDRHFQFWQRNPYLAPN